MTEEPDESIEPAEETVADLDSAADPAGGMLAMSSKDNQRCWSDEIDDDGKCR